MHLYAKNYLWPETVIENGLSRPIGAEDTKRTGRGAVVKI